MPTVLNLLLACLIRIARQQPLCTPLWQGNGRTSGERGERYEEERSLLSFSIIYSTLLSSGGLAAGYPVMVRPPFF